MDDQTPPPSRRGFLIGSGAVVVVGAGAGAVVGAALASDKFGVLTPRAKQASRELTAAAAAERALMATVDDAVTTAQARHKRVLQAIRADHAAHLAAIEAAIADEIHPAASVSASPSVSVAPPVPAGTSDLRSGESRAARAAAARALRMSGRDAVLLASIAASEAEHAVVLT
jgi:hypothetical protein